MVIRGPFALYVDMIIDYTIFYHVVVALGGFKVIIQNITSFPSIVSIRFKDRLIFISPSREY